MTHFFSNTVNWWSPYFSLFSRYALQSTSTAASIPPLGASNSSTFSTKMSTIIITSMKIPAKGPLLQHRFILSSIEGLGSPIIFSYTFSARLATLCQLQLSATNSWYQCDGTFFASGIARLSFSTMSSGHGSANFTMFVGSTSTMPPTFVETTNNPQDAASTIAMQNASVSEVFRKMCPLTNVLRTEFAGSRPSNSTRFSSLFFRITSFSASFFGPSPPMMKQASGNRRQTSGITPTSKSIPFLQVSRLTTTMLIVFSGYLFEGSGLNWEASTAFGMTDMIEGFSDALSDRFSLLVCDTEMAWSISLRKNFSTLFTWKQAASLKPKSEWSVKTVLKPIVLACMSASFPKADVAACV